jgi:hypothetical protein
MNRFAAWMVIAVVVGSACTPTVGTGTTGGNFVAPMCSPCQHDSDCGTQGLGLCVLEGPGLNFCGPTCESAENCPAGAGCIATNNASVCYPSDFTCVGYHPTSSVSGSSGTAGTTGTTGTVATGTVATGTTATTHTATTATTSAASTAATTSSGATSSGGSGSPITCSMDGNYMMNGGGCGTERWDVKTGTDPQASMVNLAPAPATIAQLAGLPTPSTLPADSRIAPTELQAVILTNVTVEEIKTESDSDYHLVLSDGNGNTMIGEVPYPGCVGSTSPFLCFITNARGAVDTEGTGATNQQATIIGVPFFDFKHGQTGVAPNAIELHPILSICFGQNCMVRTHYLRLVDHRADEFLWMIPGPFGEIPTAWMGKNQVEPEEEELDDEVGEQMDRDDPREDAIERDRREDSIQRRHEGGDPDRR